MPNFLKRPSLPPVLGSGYGPYLKLPGARGFAEGDAVEKKRFRDYQPEGILKGTIFDFIPDAVQTSAYLQDHFGDQQEPEPVDDSFDMLKMFMELTPEEKMRVAGPNFNEMSEEEIGMAMYDFISEGRALSGGREVDYMDPEKQELQPYMQEQDTLQEVWDNFIDGPNYATGGMARSPLVRRPLVRPQRSLREIIEERPRFEGNNPRFNIPAPSMSRVPLGRSVRPPRIGTPMPSIPLGPSDKPERGNKGSPTDFSSLYNAVVQGTPEPIREVRPPSIDTPPSRRTIPGGRLQSWAPPPMGPSDRPISLGTLQGDLPSKPINIKPTRPMVEGPMPIPTPPSRTEIGGTLRTPPALPPRIPGQRGALRQPPPMIPPVMQPPGRIPGGHPIRIPEPVGPMPGMPPLTPMPQTPTPPPLEEPFPAPGPFTPYESPEWDNPPPGGMDFDPSAIVEAQPPTPGTPTPPDEPMPPGFQQRPSLYEWYSMSPEEKRAWRDNNPSMGFGDSPPDVVWGPTDMTFTVDDIPRLEAQGEGPNAGVLEQLYKIRDQYAAWDRGENIPTTTPTTPQPPMPTPPGPVASPGPAIGTTPEPPMPPDVLPVGSERAQPTKEEDMERLMQMIQALQERSQPAPQAAPQAAPPQQWAPPSPRPPVAAFNMGNASAPMAAPTMPQMFNSGPGFFTPQQRGPLINQDMLGSNQNQIPMPSSSPYALDFSSFLRNR